MTQTSRETARYERIALIAACVILLSPVLYLLLPRTNAPLAPLPGDAPAAFTGSQSCKSCHESEYAKWRGSDHERAMDAATETTVLGDFGDATFTDPKSGAVSRFFRKGGKFLVETEGPDGKTGEFEIAYVFGVRPLQQYLVPFPDGRLQCLPIAWDVKEKRWYRLPPEEGVPPHDWLYWTNAGQTWNAMCAECHSTRLSKGYDPDAGVYRTTWYEINVGCEACHGPGSKHVAWASKPPLARSQTPDMGLAVKTRNLETKDQIKLCAPCHSRRFLLGGDSHVNEELLDIMVPELLREGLYYPDGQILEEVYVYGSFTQSKMYRRGVRCSDCHDVHSLKLHKEGNAVCLQCHQAKIYDAETHHFHKAEYQGKPSEGRLCVKCHMPGRTYMGVDYRPDHSIRVPRPDLSAELGTPNACAAAKCHADKPLAWTIEKYRTWYGATKKPHYGTVIAAGREHRPGADADLIQLAGDGLSPAIACATALSLLRTYPGDASRACLAKALDDEDALIRYAAIRGLEFFDAETRLKRIAPKLYDPVKAVRMEAGLMLSMLPENTLRKDDRDAFKKALEEYRQAMRYNADLPAQRYNLGNLAMNRGDVEGAIRAYRQAIAIDDRFYPAKVNLANIYNSQGNNREAEKLLRQVVAQEPELYEAAYSLGLLLAEMKNYPEAAEHLAKAASRMRYGRAYYNLGQVYLAMNRMDEAEAAFLSGLELAPEDRNLFASLVAIHLNQGRPDKARELARALLERVPGHQDAKELLRRLGE